MRPDDQDRVNPASKPLDELITRIAGAAKHQAAAGGQVAPPDLTNRLYVMCDALWPDPNIRNVLAFMGYELRPEPPSDIYPLAMMRA